MHPEVEILLQVLVIVFGFFAAVVVVGLGAKFLWPRLGGAPKALPPAEFERLQRLEDTVDTIAIEIERMSESQRFTAKLLMERSAEGASLAEPGRVSPRP